MTDEELYWHKKAEEYKASVPESLEFKNSTGYRHNIMISYLQDGCKRLRGVEFENISKAECTTQKRGIRISFWDKSGKKYNLFYHRM